MCGLLRGANGSSESADPGGISGFCFIGYFEGLSSERAIAWRVAGFAEPAGFPGSGRDGGDAEPLDAVTDSASDRRGDARGGVHVGAGAVVGSGSGEGEDDRGGRDDAGSERGDAEHRSVGIRGTRTTRSCGGWRRHLALRRRRGRELARFDRSRKGRKTSNEEWTSPQDPDAKIAKMK